MPTYRYRCEDHGDYETWRSINGPKGSDCPACGVPALQVMTPPLISASATPNRSGAPRVLQIDATEKQWDKDRPAYKRLRMDGMRPPHVDGAARLEAQATNDLEVNTGLQYGPIPERRVKEQVTQAQESGWVPTRAGV